MDQIQVRVNAKSFDLIMPVANPIKMGIQMLVQGV